MQHEEEEESHFRAQGLHDEGREAVHLQCCEVWQAQVYRVLQDSAEPFLYLLAVGIQARICEALDPEVGGGFEDSGQHFEGVVYPAVRRFASKAATSPTVARAGGVGLSGGSLADPATGRAARAPLGCSAGWGLLAQSASHLARAAAMPAYVS